MIFRGDSALSRVSFSAETPIRIPESVLVNDFWTPPPPINFVLDQISIYLVLFRVRLG